MKVVWIVPRQALKNRAGGVSSDLASIRYRAIIPMQGLIARGHDASVIGLDRDCVEDVRRHIADADRLVFIKNYTDPVCSEKVLEEQHARGIKTWFDLTDDRFQGEASEHLRRMVQLAENVVTVSSTLRQIIVQHTGKASEIVGDPYEGPRGSPRWSPAGARLKALWFGYGWNIPGLMQALPALSEAGKQFPMDLRIVTAGVEGIERYCEKFNRNSAGALSLHYASWSSAETWRSLEAADVVLIPALLDEQWTLAKSPNRIIEALWSGRFVVTHPIPSYLEFKEWAWIGANLAEGIAWVMHNQKSIAGRIAAAQDHIAAVYSPDNVAAQWERILEKT
jgi:glycosyltransferase involved in cell wall biosynthesis